MFIKFLAQNNITKRFIIISLALFLVIKIPIFIFYLYLGILGKIIEGEQFISWIGYELFVSLFIFPIVILFFVFYGILNKFFNIKSVLKLVCFSLIILIGNAALSLVLISILSKLFLDI
jgi:hypothetical protein